MISYEELLAVFWSSHRPTASPWSAQYKSALFVHDESQRAAAEQSRAAESERHGTPMHTEILDAGTFTRAEDYHQKYRLRGSARWMALFREFWPDEREFADSTAAMRVNAYLDGDLKREALLAELERIDLPEAARRRLLETLRG